MQIFSSLGCKWVKYLSFANLRGFGSRGLRDVSVQVPGSSCGWLLLLRLKHPLMKLQKKGKKKQYKPCSPKEKVNSEAEEL